jgi:hemerythrin-like metal-binding protein
MGNNRDDFYQIIVTQLEDVGVPRFNQAHEGLLQIIVDADMIIASTLERSLTTQEWEGLSKVIDELIRYTLIHFKEEVIYLRQNQYPESDKHQEHHNNLIKELAHFNQMAVQQDESGIITMRKWLLEWLLQHVNHEDVSYREYFKSI